MIRVDQPDRGTGVACFRLADLIINADGDSAVLDKRGTESKRLPHAHVHQFVSGIVPVADDLHRTARIDAENVGTVRCVAVDDPVADNIAGLLHAVVVAIDREDSIF